MRRDRLDHVENFPHLGALPNDVIEPGQAAKLPAEIASLFFPLQAFRDLADGAAKLVDQFVVFDDIAVGARVNGGDGGFDRRDAGNEQEEALRSDLFGEF